MNTIRTLHLASFSGNIGDNANHRGSKKLFLRNDLPALHYEQMEIRDFYRGQRKFDLDFIQYANTFDLLFIGGGNFFELWPPDSKSGTSINLDILDLEKIKVPILFYSLGVDVGLGCSEDNKKKFKAFLDYCIQKPEIFVSVRNDGAISNLTNLYGKKFASKMTMIPDGGFFADYPACSAIKNNPVKNIAINIAGDMLDVRTKNIGFDNYIDEIAKFLMDFHANYHDYITVFFPHIFKDYTIITSLFDKLPDEISRNKLQIAPYAQGDQAAEIIWGQYRQCELVLANRFHANVVPIGMGIPTIGLCNYPQIYGLYKELEIQDRLIDCSKSGFSKNLMDLTGQTLAALPEVKNRLRNISLQVNKSGDENIQCLKSWFQQNFK